MELSGISCVVTGSTGVIGRAIALSLAGAGADCICHYHMRADLAEELAGQVVRLGRKARVVQADLRQAGQIDRLFEPIRVFFPLRLLVNSAAVFCRRALGDINASTLADMMSLNLTAPLLTSAAFVRAIGQGQGKIINLADVGGLHPWAHYAEYCASKAALIAITKSLAKELAPRITVNAIAAGIVTHPQDLAAEQKLLSRIPAGRFGVPEEIAAAALFLAQNDYITGQVIQADGGRYI